jgi:dihydrofolate reductase
MRRVCFSAAMSLDGYIAGPKQEIDWIVTDPDRDFAASTARFDTALIGRKTFDFMRRHGSTTIPSLQLYVISRTLSQSECRDATVSGESEATVRSLKARPGKDIWLFGGGELFRSLLGAGLVDTVELAVIPVLLGGGLPLLPPPGSGARLRLLQHRIYPKTGTVFLEYAVNNSKPVTS